MCCKPSNGFLDLVITTANQHHSIVHHFLSSSPTHSSLQLTPISFVPHWTTPHPSSSSSSFIFSSSLSPQKKTTSSLSSSHCKISSQQHQLSNKQSLNSNISIHQHLRTTKTAAFFNTISILLFSAFFLHLLDIISTATTPYQQLQNSNSSATHQQQTIL